MTRAIFVPAIGQYDNIGDIVLRRPLLRWLREAGPLHVFVGRGVPRGYVAALDLGPGDVVYRSFLRWYLAALRAGLAGGLHYAFKPGEIQMSLGGLKEHVAVLPLLLLTRWTGGRVVRIGSGTRDFARWPLPLMRPSMALSDLLLWRDAQTQAHVGCGATMPDLAFADGDDGPGSHPRPWLVVSMRGDRHPVPEVWIAAVRQFARQQRLRLRVVTQVQRDAGMSRSLAVRLQADLLDWSAEPHDEQEHRLREAYRQAAVVVSDRLHVLIAAFTHGAVPAALLTESSGKIERHFLAAGIEGVASPVGAGDDTGAALAAMTALVARRSALFDALRQARRQLDDVRAQLLSLLRAERR